MYSIDRFEKIFLYRPYADFRKSIDGLCAIIQGEMALSPFSNYIFLFCNKNRSKIKVLYWDKTGFALWYKRLEKEKYRWPKMMEEKNISLTSQQLDWLLDGYDFWKMKPHQKLDYETTV